jgi:hypothetical protein
MNLLDLLAPLSARKALFPSTRIDELCDLWFTHQQLHCFIKPGDTPFTQQHNTG